MLFATGLMTRRHMSLEECLSHISKGRAEFCNTLIRPVHFTSADLPLTHEDRVKEIARTRTNLRLTTTRGSDDPRPRPNFFTAFYGRGYSLTGLRPWATTQLSLCAIYHRNYEPANLASWWYCFARQIRIKTAAAFNPVAAWIAAAYRPTCRL